MDPKACLDEIRSIIKERFYSGFEDPAADRLLELVESLDHWMSKGGFSPWED